MTHRQPGSGPLVEQFITSGFGVFPTPNAADENYVLTAFGTAGEGGIVLSSDPNALEQAVLRAPKRLAIVELVVRQLAPATTGAAGRTATYKVVHVSTDLATLTDTGIEIEVDALSDAEHKQRLSTPYPVQEGEFFIVTVDNPAYGAAGTEQPGQVSLALATIELGNG